MDFQSLSRILVACPDRMAPFVVSEIESLGYAVEDILRTGVIIRGSLRDCIRLNLHLRCATQVRFALSTFQADNPEHIYRHVRRMPWEEIIPADGYFSVNNSANHPTLNNTMFLNVRVKDAIADRFREVAGKRPDAGTRTDRVVVHVHWRDDQAEIFLDTSGDVLSRHGYRRIPGKAPMQESLASAVLLATGWDGKSPFVNPMCGSGTLAIEAALLATGRRPGLLRSNFAFMHLQGYDPSLYAQERQALDGLIDDSHCPRIIASDFRSNAVEDARENARMAGVEQHIEFACCDFRETPLPEPPATIILNPEYGERMGDEQELTETYSAIGDFFKKSCAGFSGFIFTGNLELAKQIGLKPSRRIEFYSAQIDCRLLRYELYAGSRRTANDQPPVS